MVNKNLDPEEKQPSNDNQTIIEVTNHETPSQNTDGLNSNMDDASNSNAENEIVKSNDDDTTDSTTFNDDGSTDNHELSSDSIEDEVVDPNDGDTTDSTTSNDDGSTDNHELSSDSIEDEVVDPNDGDATDSTTFNDDGSTDNHKLSSDSIEDEVVDPNDANATDLTANDAADTTSDQELSDVPTENEAEEKNNQRKRKGGFLYWLLILICLVVLFYSGYKILDAYIDNKKASDEYKSLTNKYKPTIPAVQQEENDEPIVEEPVYSLADLIKINPDTFSWITIPDTRIDYPVVQGKDNDYYLDQTVQKNKSRAGAIFLDYRNNRDLSDFNTIVYGHEMNNGSMFADLNKYEKENRFFDNHLEGWLVTEEKTYRLEIFASYVTSETSQSYQINFATTEDKIAYLNFIKESAKHFRDIGITENDHILTMSTCVKESETDRMVVQARIVEQTP